MKNSLLLVVALVGYYCGKSTKTMMNRYNHLASREGFNIAIRHFKTVGSISSEVERGYNLADLLLVEIAENRVTHDQTRAILNALLKDKLEYTVLPLNLTKNIEKADKIVQTFEKWSNLQIVLAYFDPNSGLRLINPAIKSQLEAVLPLLQDELLVIYVDVLSGVQANQRAQMLKGAADDILKILYGGTVAIKKGYGGFRRLTIDRAQRLAEAEVIEESVSDSESEDRARTSAPAAPQGPKRMTPRYSVSVTNELFHNGNVEAWKNIIEAYNHKYPDNEVLIWYENERINDINTLFKWGKVKHGTPIIISIMGSEFKEISKLQRYLFEGASPRFENFLRGAPGQILDIF